MHLEDGQLKAYLDNALSSSEQTASAEHIKACATCSRRAEGISARRSLIDAELANLTRVEASTNPRTALSKFHSRYDRKQEETVFNRIFGRPMRPVWAAVIVIVLLAASMTFAPVRAWAGQFLELFRVQTVEVLPVDPTLMNQLTGNSALSEQIGQLLSQSLTYSKKPSKPQTAANAAEAAKLAGFQVRLPTSRTDPPQLVVSGGSAFQFVVDRKLAQGVIDQAGRGDLQLPTTIDGATIKVNIPAGVSAAYGDCPPAQELTEERTSGSSPARRFVNCIILAQIPSPTLDTPPDLDVEKLAVLGLEFSGMKADQAEAYAQTVDWTSTLVIPVPRNAASYNEVQVDGVSGYLIQRPVDDAPQYAVIWVKNGIVYAIGGVGTNTGPALQMANSLK